MVFIIKFCACSVLSLNPIAEIFIGNYLYYFLYLAVTDVVTFVSLFN